MPITASELRANIYRLFDEVLETERPLEIERKGKTLIVAPKERTSKLARIRPNPDFIVGDPDDLISMDWSSEWRP